MRALAVREKARKARRAAASKQNANKASGIGEEEEGAAGERVDKVADHVVEPAPVEKSASAAMAPLNEHEASVAPAPRVLSTEDLERDE
ncbi:hypothetical protein GGF31_000621 [Allomyces arbusculus]|nr:hypothetical protein GGF31_000621 [Allomyces arbusculus]